MCRACYHKGGIISTCCAAIILFNIPHWRCLKQKASPSACTSHNLDIFNIHLIKMPDHEPLIKHASSAHAPRSCTTMVLGLFFNRSQQLQYGNIKPAENYLEPPTASAEDGKGLAYQTLSRIEDLSDDMIRGCDERGPRLSQHTSSPPFALSSNSSEPIDQRKSSSIIMGEQQNHHYELEEEGSKIPIIVKQPDTRPITQEQLVAEVKGIYEGLVLVETKCIEVDNTQLAQADQLLNDEQWRDLIALHRTLLHEHHDFLLASQHPSASSALKKLPLKYAMPARLWRHGIHSFLELLRDRLPASLEHMISFTHLAYSLLVLLYETLPVCKKTWIECLGDVSRYRMSIEKGQNRGIWKGISRYWYSKVSDKTPNTGRLYHHLAILAEPAIPQLFYFTKSLCVAEPFESTRSSIYTLLDPSLHSIHSGLPPIDFAFVKAHGILFSMSNPDTYGVRLESRDEMMLEYKDTKCELLKLLDAHITHTTLGWMEPGALIAIVNSNALLEYGNVKSITGERGNVIMSVLTPQVETEVEWAAKEAGQEAGPRPSHTFNMASILVRDCDLLLFNRRSDANVLPYVNVRLSFMCFWARTDAIRYLEHGLPWAALAEMLTLLASGMHKFERIESFEFPLSHGPLCEDWNLRGLLWTDALFPSEWFSNHSVDEGGRSIELPSMAADRRERVLWLGWNLAAYRRWIVYHRGMKQFRATPDFADHNAGITMVEKCC